MTDSADPAADADGVAHRATIRTTHACPAVVAAALRPDNTDEMDTRVEDGEDGGGGRVVTTVERETAGGLRATVDDYVVNLAVADSIVRRTTDHSQP